ncbi:MAG: hypothetical protein M5U28_37340 [Sandaracinaceae bacterium]|nr:hypothetical protein [Sandaracinaceae bacterium]
MLDVGRADPAVAIAHAEQHARAAQARAHGGLLLAPADARPGDGHEPAEALLAPREELDRQARALREAEEVHLRGLHLGQDGVDQRAQRGERALEVLAVLGEARAVRLRVPGVLRRLRREDADPRIVAHQIERALQHAVGVRAAAVDGDHHALGLGGLGPARARRRAACLLHAPRAHRGPPPEPGVAHPSLGDPRVLGGQRLEVLAGHAELEDRSRRARARQRVVERGRQIGVARGLGHLRVEGRLARGELAHEGGQEHRVQARVIEREAPAEPVRDGVLRAELGAIDHRAGERGPGQRVATALAQGGRLEQRLERPREPLDRAQRVPAHVLVLRAARQRADRVGERVEEARRREPLRHREEEARLVEHEVGPRARVPARALVAALRDPMDARHLRSRRRWWARRRRAARARGAAPCRARWPSRRPP